MMEESSVLRVGKRLKAERPTRLICTTLLLRLLSVDGGQSIIVIAQRADQSNAGWRRRFVKLDMVKSTLQLSEWRFVPNGTHQLPLITTGTPVQLFKYGRCRQPF